MDLAIHRSMVLVALIATGSSPARGQTADAPVVTPAIGQGEYIKSIAFSPDGKWIASSGHDSIAVWDLVSGAVLRKFVAASISSVAVSPDGQFVASVGANKVKVWNVSNGKLVQDFGDQLKQAVAFSPDGRWIASTRWTLATLPEIVIFDAKSGAEIRTLRGHEKGALFPISSLSLSADGHFLASAGDDKTVRLWDPATGRLLRTLRGHPAKVQTVAVSRNGRLIASGGEKDKSARVWDAESGAVKWTLPSHPDEINSVAFSPDERWLVSGSSKAIKLWDATSGKLQWSVEDNVNFTDLKFSPDGSWIASGTLNQTIVLLDVSNGRVVRELAQRTEALHPVVFSPDGSWLASGGRRLRRWDAASGRELATASNAVERAVGIAVSPDGKTLVAGKSLIDVANGRLLKKIDGLEPYSLGNALTFSRDGRWFASAEAKSVRIWDASDGRLIRTIAAHSEDTKSVAASRDGRTIASISFHEVKLWDVATGRALRTFLSEHRCRLGSAITRCGVGNHAVAFSPDGQRLAVAAGVIGFHFEGKHGTLGWGLLRLWATASGRLLRAIDDFPSDVHAIAFSPDGGSIVAASKDNTISILDSTNGRRLKSLHGHSTVVKSLAYSPDGRSIAGGSESEIKLWSAESGEVLATIVASATGDWAAITAEGFFDSSKDGAKLLYVVRGFDVITIDQAYQALFRPDLVEQLFKGDPEGRYRDAASKLNLQKILESGSAPQIEALPERKAERIGDTVRLTLRIVDTGGGIGEKVVWRVNGVVQGDVTSGQSPQPTTRGGYRIVTQTLRIDPSRRNLIEVTAYNAPGLLATVPYRIEIDEFGATMEKRPTMHVLALGVSTYAQRDWNLQYAVTDAKVFAETLRSVAGALYDSVKVTTLLDGEVTTSGIEAALNRVSGEVQASDVFVLFVAGHGRNIAGTYYFLPQDLRFEGGRTIMSHGIGQETWQTWLARVPAQKSILIFDTCESSAAAGLTRGERDRETAMDRLRHATGRSVITAARQAAYEGYRGHGVLTYAVLEALTRAEGSREDEIDLYQLAAHVDRQVPVISERLFGIAQRPHNKIEGNFPLGVRKIVATLGTLVEIPKTASHVLVRPEHVRERPEKGAPGLLSLQPGAQVRVVELEGDWAQIARDGEKLGYVPAEALVKLH